MNKNKTNKPAILLVYTGGTIGMYENPKTGALENFDFDQLIHYVPEVEQFGYHIDSISFDPPIDSSDISPTYWRKLAHIIGGNYEQYGGFVVLHGTDTMSFTASALSYMLENLGKPVILTGSQLPIGQIRTDGKENLLTAIEIAAAKNANGDPMVTEVCIFFERKLMRGNRTTKTNAQGFNAFHSHNYPSLAEAGIHIDYYEHRVRRPLPESRLIVHDKLDEHILVLTLFPGIRQDVVEAMLNVPKMRAVVLKTYGSGNAPQKAWLVNLIAALQARGILVVNITQCLKGRVEMERYGTGLQLLKAGVINGYDCTFEGMMTKLMFLLGQEQDVTRLRELLNTSIAGEITID